MPGENRAAIDALILESRRNLLDLSLRNRMLNHRVTKTRDIEVTGGQPSEILRALVTGLSALGFAGADDDQPAGGQASLELEPAARRLQTRIPASELQLRLLKIHVDARTALEEQGANLLFLALGMVEWFESPEAQEPRRAPLLLVPVALQRSGSDRFTLRYSGEDVGTNLSFAAKLKGEYNVDLPTLADDDEIDVAAYFDAVESVISGIDRWRVARDKVVLGFFTFARFLMYRDLDPDGWPAQDGPGDHPVMDALVTRFADLDCPLSEAAFLDDLRPVGEVHEVVDADSSQVLAIEDVKAGRTLVIEGPPGTGKSQTITNLIAEAVASGRKVLFVSEKMAALSVVKRNLDQVGLGDACLELHSHQANKREFIRELERTLNLAAPRAVDADPQLAQLAAARDRLTAYDRELHEVIGESLITPHQAMGRLLQLGAASRPGPRGNFAEVETRDRRTLAPLLELAARLQARLDSGGPPRLNPYRDCRPAALLPMDRPLLERELDEAIAAAARLREAGAELARALRLPAPDHVGQVASQAALATGLSNCPAFADQAALDAPDWLAGEATVKAGLAAGAELDGLHRAHDPALREGAWQADVTAALVVLRRFERRWWRGLSSAFRGARALGRGLLRSPEAPPLATLITLLEAVDRAQRLEADFAAAAPDCARLLGGLWRGRQTDWTVAGAAAAWAVSLHREVEAGAAPREVLKLRFTPDFCAELLRRAQDADLALGAYREAWSALDTRLVPGPGLFPAGREQAPLAAQGAVLDGWREDPERLWHHVGYRAVRDEAEAAGLASLCAIADDWTTGQPPLPWVLEATWLEGLLRRAFSERRHLAAFDALEHEQLVARFADLDRSVLNLNRARVAAAHRAALPSRAGGGAIGILATQIGLKQRHLPIRRLMERCWQPVLAIKPILMMSPMSVAMFLPPDGPRFDLVIFDEASQVRPEDAFGAVLRGSQVVVVGDSKQMPPTSFFARLASGDESEEEVAESGVRDMESILGLFRARNAPYRQLRWHYRSRHHSLIAVSNREFYDDRLVVFPSPGDGDGSGRFGLSLRHLPDTAYGRGGSRSNAAEARAVAEAVAEHARTSPDLSLGVAAFSQAQQDAIQTQLERMRPEHPELRLLETRHPQEPFFVKNLENVQGDERDVIFISVGYGRDADGYLSHSFGPLNLDGGERRLNVLISRAKHRCVVFCNFVHHDLDLQRSQSRGVRTLKTFLKYAETRELDTPRPVGGDPESPFEEAVLAALLARGHRVDCQVGSAGFRLDFAIADPDRPGRYLLGIECDGAKYHSARSARDRDRLREQVLRARGWRLHRIWGPTWFRDPEGCLDRIDEAVQSARSQVG